MRKIRRIFKILIVIGIVIYLIPVTLMTSKMFGERLKADDYQNIIVMGAWVDGDQPGEGLERRLKTAIQLANQYPNAQIIVSGGQGSDEEYPECDVMSKYLQEHGISKDRITKESQATSTLENIVYSKEVGDITSTDENIVISNPYHLYRSDLMCKRSGINCTVRGSSPTIYYGAFTREPLAIYKSLLLDYPSNLSKLSANF